MAGQKHTMSRRQMLKTLGVSVAAGTLAACTSTPPAASSTPNPEAATTAPLSAGMTNTPATEQTANIPAAGNIITRDMDTGVVAETYETGQAAYGWYDEVHPSNSVELLVWGPPGDQTDPHIAAVMAAVDRFQMKYPEIKVKYEPIPWDDYPTKLNAAITAKQGPDVMFEDGSSEAAWARDGVIRPLDQILEPSYLKDHNFVPLYYPNDGKLYWVYTSVMGTTLYVNRQLLATEGLKPADMPTTWDEFAKFAQQLTRVEGGNMVQAGFSFNGFASRLWTNMMAQQGIDIYDPRQNPIKTPESEYAWQVLIDFYDKYRINDRTFLNWDEGFGAGKAAITSQWTWYTSALQSNYPDLDWTAAVYPTFTGKGPYGRADMEGPLWMISSLAQGDKLTAAIEFFKFHIHDYRFLVDRVHSNGMILVTEPHPNYEKSLTEVAAKEQLTPEERRLQVLAALSKQYQGGLFFGGDELYNLIHGLFDNMADAILTNKRPIKDVLVESAPQYDEAVTKLHK